MDHIPGHNSVLGAAFNVLNSIIGSGIIGLPYALNNAGMVTGVLMLVVIGAVSLYSTYILVLTGKRTGAMHYSEVTRRVLGPIGYQCLNASMVLSLLGVLVTYLIILGDIVVGLRATYLPDMEWVTRSVIIAGIAYVLVLPLLFFRHAGPLAKISVVAVVALPVILAIIAIRAPLYASEQSGFPLVVGPHVFRALGVLCFSYCSAHAAFQNFSGLKHRTLGNWAKAVSLAGAAAILVCCGFAITGLMSFGSQVQANIFLNFPDTDIYLSTAKLIFCLTLAATFPLTYYPVRDTFTHVFGIDTSSPGGHLAESLFTLVCLTSVVWLASVCTDLGLAYELIGAATATTLSFIFPALMFLKAGTNVTLSRALFNNDDEEADSLLLDSDKHRWRRQVWQWMGGWFTLYFGIVVFLVGTFNVILR